MQFVPKENAVTFREASTANLLIDSIDRNFGPGPPQPNATAANFTINKRNSILNGFFTRLAVTEIVLDWCIPNISAVAGNNTFTVTVTAGVVATVTLPDGHYTAARALTTLATLLGAGFSIAGTVPTTGYASLDNATGFTITATNLSNELTLTSLPNGTESANGTSFSADCPAILPYTALDFVCSELTYNQALKDDSSNSYQRNILYRWVFAWEGEASYDAMGYPVFQGYLPFRARRYLAFPKQIRWENNMPIGQMSFQVYSSEGELLEVPANGDFEWNMLLQVSEV